MRLYTKIALTLGVTGLICTLASVVAVAFIVVPQYLKMDREAALANGARAYEFLQSETDKSMSSVGDWGHWDDTFAFAKTLDKEYIASNLKQEDLETILVDEYVLADYDGTIRFEHAANQSEDAPRVPFAGLKSVPKAHWTDASKFSDREVRAGIALTAAGPAIVTLTAITDSNGGGPSPGVLMFVRMVDEEILAALRKKTRLDFTLEPVGEKAKPPASAEAAVIGAAKDVPARLIKHADRIEAQVVLKDLSGAPSYVLSVSTPPRFANMAVATMWSTLALLLLIGAIAGFVVAAFMRRVITAPLEHIIAHTKAISSTGNLDSGLNLRRRDEIGMLGDAFDAMLADLRRTRAALQEQSFVSGMANIAAEMLHNIRNTLSPVSAAVWKGRESLKDLKTDRLIQAGETLAGETIEPEKKTKLAEYIAASARHINDRCRTAEAEFETINGFTHQIELVLKHHEELSRGVRAIEDVRLADVVEAAAKLARQSRKPAIEVVVAPSLERLRPVSAERVVLIQVLGNLVVNAIQAIERAGATHGRIAFDARDTGRDVELTITDNGVGIAPEHLVAVFERGFTSRPGQGSGLGLHYCATSLGVMGGSIGAESAGPGRGATFRLRLPVAREQDKAA